MFSTRSFGSTQVLLAVPAYYTENERRRKTKIEEGTKEEGEIVVAERERRRWKDTKGEGEGEGEGEVIDEQMKEEDRRI